MGESEVAKIRPQWVSCNIRYDHRLLTVDRCAARSQTRSDFQSVNCFTVLRRKTRSSASSQSLAISVKKKNGTKHSGIMLFDIGTQSRQRFRQRTLTHNHGQNAVIKQRQNLRTTRFLGIRRFLGSYRHDGSYHIHCPSRLPPSYWSNRIRRQYRTVPKKFGKSVWIGRPRLLPLTLIPLRPNRGFDRQSFAHLPR